MSVTPIGTKKAGFGKSVAWSLAVLAALPATLGVLWLAGYIWGKGTNLVDRIGVTWSQVWIGLAVMAGYAVILGVVHAVRTYRARTALYTTATQTLHPHGTVTP